jgi:hypothetical protein
MNPRPLQAALGRIRATAAARRLAGLSDGELLARFAGGPR